MRSKLFIATPMYGGTCHGGFASSLLNLSRLVEYEHSFVTGDSMVTRARNMLTHQFLESDCSHLFFVDADVAFDAGGVAKMLEADKSVIGGLYAKKAINWGRVAAAARSGVHPADLPNVAGDYYVRGYVSSGKDLDTPVKVKSIGTGLMLIKKEVFMKLMPTTRKTKLGSALHGRIESSEEIFEFFETLTDEETGEFLSEDYAFCQKWKNVGGSVYAAPWLQTVHIGTHHYR